MKRLFNWKTANSKRVAGVSFEDPKEKQAAFARAEQLHGKAGFSRYVRNLIEKDLASAKAK